MKKKVFILLCGVILFAHCNRKKNIGIMAKKIPELFNYHQDTIIDNYSWMRLTDQQKESTTPDKQTKNVLEFLQN